MKHLFFILIGFLPLKNVFAQDSSRVRHELGSKIISLTVPIQVYYSIADQPNFQFVNGLFYRASKRRMAFRAILNYSENKTESFYWDGDQIGTLPSGFSNNQDFQIAIGGQYNLLKSKEFLYAFVDLYYRNLSSEGELSWYEQNLDCRFFAKTDQAGLNTGLGFKVKLFKHVYISPEIFGDMFISNTSMVQYSKVDDSESDVFYSTLNIRPVARLFLTVSF